LQPFFIGLESYRGFRLLADPHAVTQGLSFIPDGQKHHFSIHTYAQKTPIDTYHVYVRNTLFVA